MTHVLYACLIVSFSLFAFVLGRRAKMKDAYDRGFTDGQEIAAHEASMRLRRALNPGAKMFRFAVPSLKGDQ